MFTHQQTHDTAALSILSRQLSKHAGLPVKLLAQTGSTNQLLLDSADDLPLHPQPPCALMALAQSAGRGRRGREWIAAPSPAAQTHLQSNIYPSFLASLGVRCTLPLQALTMLPLHIGVAVVQTLNQWGCAAQLKWPNDIVIRTPQGSAKLGGILVETRNLGIDANNELAVVLGMGLNWHSAPKLADKLTANVADHASNAPNGLDTSAALIVAMALAWQRCVDAERCDFAPHDALYGLDITAVDASSTVQHGVAKGINAQGHLGLQLSAGALIWLHSGEVSVRGY